MHTALRICLISLLPLLVWSAEPKKISQAEALDLVTSKVPPEYPAMAKQLNLTGVVEVEVVVTANGAVDTAVPISGSPILTRPAADALRRWKFKPLQENGAAVGFKTTIKVNFQR